MTRPSAHFMAQLAARVFFVAGAMCLIFGWGVLVRPLPAELSWPQLVGLEIGWVACWALASGLSEIKQKRHS